METLLMLSVIAIGSIIAAGNLWLLWALMNGRGGRGFDATIVAALLWFLTPLGPAMVMAGCMSLVSG